MFLGVLVRIYMSREMNPVVHENVYICVCVCMYIGCKFLNYCPQ